MRFPRILSISTAAFFAAVLTLSFGIGTASANCDPSVMTCWDDLPPTTTTVPPTTTTAPPTTTVPPTTTIPAPPTTTVPPTTTIPEPSIPTSPEPFRSFVPLRADAVEECEPEVVVETELVPVKETEFPWLVIGLIAAAAGTFGYLLGNRSNDDETDTDGEDTDGEDTDDTEASNP